MASSAKEQESHRQRQVPSTVHPVELNHVHYTCPKPLSYLPESEKALPLLPEESGFRTGRLTEHLEHSSGSHQQRTTSWTPPSSWLSVGTVSFCESDEEYAPFALTKEKEYKLDQSTVAEDGVRDDAWEDVEDNTTRSDGMASPEYLRLSSPSDYAREQFCGEEERAARDIRLAPHPLFWYSRSGLNSALPPIDTDLSVHQYATMNKTSPPIRSDETVKRLETMPTLDWKQNYPSTQVPKVIELENSVQKQDKMIHTSSIFTTTIKAVHLYLRTRSDRSPGSFSIFSRRVRSNRHDTDVSRAQIEANDQIKDVSQEPQNRSKLAGRLTGLNFIGRALHAKAERKQQRQRDQLKNKIRRIRDINPQKVKYDTSAGTIWF